MIRDRVLTEACEMYSEKGFIDRVMKASGNVYSSKKKLQKAVDREWPADAQIRQRGTNANPTHEQVFDLLKEVVLKVQTLGRCIKARQQS